MPTRTEGSTGIRVPVSPPTPATGDVLTDVVLERHRQIHLWGHNEDTPDGTGPDVRWLKELARDAITGEWPAGYHSAASTAETLELVIRAGYERKAQAGEQLTWVDFLLEELTEAFKEDDPAKLYPELIQVAAVAVSWAEKIRQR